MKLLDRYETENIKIKDEGLKSYISLKGNLVPKSRGRKTDRFDKADVNIVERLVSVMCVPGHRGKKQKIQTSWATGKYNQNMKRVIKAFKIIEEKTGENPLQVLVRAIENGSPKDGVTTVEYGGARYPQSVDMSPLKRVNLTVRNLVHGGHDKSFKKKPNMEEGLANEIMQAAEGSKESNAVNKKEQLEKQADAAR